MCKTSSAWRCAVEYLIFVLLLLIVAMGMLFLFWWIKQSSPAVSATAESAAFTTVIIDAGHGGEDGGAVGKTEMGEVYEKDLNLTIAMKLRDRLTQAGITVIMTREKDVLLYDRNTDYHGRRKVLDLAARLHIGESTPDALFISIHMNAFPQSKYHGLQVYYSPNHPLSRTLAQAMQTKAAADLQPDNQRKIKQAGSNIFILDRLQCPAVMIECGFLSNAAECAVLQNENYQDRLVAILADCILSAQRGSAENIPAAPSQ